MVTTPAHIFVGFPGENRQPVLNSQQQLGIIIFLQS
jgi:hypothetical protein